MSQLPPWDDLIAGKNCPLCAPREDENAFSIKIADLDASTLYLERDQTHPGYCVLIYKERHVTGLEQLHLDEHARFAADMHKAAKAVARATGADHMNYATLGNMIPHLHYHIIPRYKNDPRWGAPVWVTHLRNMPHTVKKDAEYHDMIGKIRKELGA